MNLKPFIIREQVIKAIRSFFEERNFHEIITPVLNSVLPLEPNIYAFETVWKTNKGEKKFYLSTSPEATLKKMLAQGIGNCFAISKAFRNLEGSGRLHSPEFLMLEWYREDADYKDIMRDCEGLVGYVYDKCKMQNAKCKITIKNSKVKNKSIYKGDKIDLSIPYKRISMVELFKKYARSDFYKIIDDKKMIVAAQKKGYKVENCTWESLFNQIFLNEIEPNLPIDPIFITDFPARTSPLCRPKKDKPVIAERFELYIGGIELGNGNTENTDAVSIKKKFLEEQNIRKEKGEISPPIDEEFLDSLDKMKGNRFAGIGMGVDRLAMILGGIGDIKKYKGQD